MHNFVTSYIGCLKNTGSLNYTTNLPNTDIVHYAITLVIPTDLIRKGSRRKMSSSRWQRDSPKF